MNDRIRGQHIPEPNLEGQHKGRAGFDPRPRAEIIKERLAKRGIVIMQNLPKK